MQVIVPLVCFAIPFLAGLILVRKRIKYLVPAFAIGFAILMIWAIYKGQLGWNRLRDPGDLDGRSGFDRNAGRRCGRPLAT